MNYSEEQTQYIVEAYNQDPSMATVESLANQLNKTIKSIIGKLSREGVYERSVYKNKSGESPITKLELVNNIAENLGIEVEHLAGLDKSPKPALKQLELATGSTREADERTREPWHNRS